jgi:chromosome segregation ATPase
MGGITIEEKLAARGIALSNASEEEKQAVLAALEVSDAAIAEQAAKVNASEEERQAVLAALEASDAAIAEQAAKVAELEAKVAELTQSPEAIKALSEERDALAAQLEQAHAELEKAAALFNAEASKPKADAGYGEFSFEKKKYQITVAAAIVPGKGKVTAADILKDKDLQAHLIEIKCGTIKELK